MKQESRRTAIRSALRGIVTSLAAAWLAVAGAAEDGSPWHHDRERAERLVLSGDATAARNEYQKALAEAASPEERGRVRIALADLLSAPDSGPTAAELREARRLYREALKELATPGASDEARRLASVARNNPAVLLLERGQAAKALGFLEEPAVSQTPADLRALLLHNRGLAFERLGRPIAASQDFLAAVAADPSYRPAVENLGGLVLDLSPKHGPEIAGWAAGRLVAIGELAAAEALLAHAFEIWGPSAPLISSLTGYLASARVGSQEFKERWWPRLAGREKKSGIATLEAVYTGELAPDAPAETLPDADAWRLPIVRGRGGR